jgi:hypothetical protein
MPKDNRDPQLLGEFLLDLAKDVRRRHGVHVKLHHVADLERFKRAEPYTKIVLSNENGKMG